MLAQGEGKTFTSSNYVLAYTYSLQQSSHYLWFGSFSQSHEMHHCNTVMGMERGLPWTFFYLFHCVFYHHGYLGIQSTTLRYRSPFSIMYCSSQHHRVLVVFLDFQSPSKQVVAPPQRPTAAGLYSNPHDCPCTLSGDLHGGRRAVLKIWNFEHFSYCNTYSDLASDVLHGGRSTVLKIWNFWHFFYCSTYSD